MFVYSAFVTIADPLCTEIARKQSPLYLHEVMINAHERSITMIIVPYAFVSYPFSVLLALYM